MSKPKLKFVMLELELDDLMQVIAKLCELLVEAKKNPEKVFKMIPDEPERLMIFAMEATVEMRKRRESEQQPETTSTPDQQAEAMRAAMEVLAKAQMGAKH